MGEMLLNGRVPLDWERAAMERGRAHQLERDTGQLAGLLPDPGAEPVLRAYGRPVTDLDLLMDMP